MLVPFTKMFIPNLPINPHPLQFEVNLETLKRMRRGRVRIQNHSANALYLGLRHLYSIYARALKKFPGDEALWMQYFRFCLQTGSSRRLSRAFGTYVSRFERGKSIVIFLFFCGSWIASVR